MMKTLSFEYVINRKIWQQEATRHLIRFPFWRIYFGSCVFLFILILVGATIITNIYPNTQPIWKDFGWIVWILFVIVIGLSILMYYHISNLRFRRLISTGANVRITLDTEGYTYESKFLRTRISWVIVSKVYEREAEFMFLGISSSINLRFPKRVLAPDTVEEIRKFISETILPVLARNKASKDA